MADEQKPGEGFYPGAQYVCSCPEPVTKLESISGRVVATLESGMKMIVPRANPKRDEKETA